MESGVSRGRGGSWRRGGRGGNDSNSFGGEHRGRGRGGPHRGRGKRDHYRGRGRGRSAHVVDLPERDEDEGNKFEEEDGRMQVFSRRKLESNWDRYAEPELVDRDNDTPTQRGADYHVLLESAGDSFTQFRFSEERDWEMDPFTASQMSAVFLDLPALAHSLQQVPLHQRLNLEADLVQVSTPAELSVVTLTPKQEEPKTSKFTPSSTAFRNPSQKTPVAAESVVDDGDEELDQLLGLQKPDSGVTGKQSISGADEETAPLERAHEELAPEVKEKDVTPPKSASVREEMSEEDLEDWLDSMIS